jgi:hypothetical protein
MFLMGPIKQLVKMFEKGRIVATLIYFAAMFATLFAAIRVNPCMEKTSQIFSAHQSSCTGHALQCGTEHVLAGHAHCMLHPCNMLLLIGFCVVCSFKTLS